MYVQFTSCVYGEVTLFKDKVISSEHKDYVDYENRKPLCDFCVQKRSIEYQSIYIQIETFF